MILHATRLRCDQSIRQIIVTLCLCGEFFSQNDPIVGILLYICTQKQKYTTNNNNNTNYEDFHQRKGPGATRQGIGRGIRHQERPFQISASGQEQDALDDILQQLAAHPPVYSEGGHELGHERDCARRERRRMEAGDGARRHHGRRQERASARSHSRDGLLLRHHRRALVCRTDRPRIRLCRNGAPAVHQVLGSPRVRHGDGHRAPPAGLRRPDYD